MQHICLHPGRSTTLGASPSDGASPGDAIKLLRNLERLFEYATHLSTSRPLKDSSMRPVYECYAWMKGCFPATPFARQEVDLREAASRRRVRTLSCRPGFPVVP